MYDQNNESLKRTKLTPHTKRKDVRRTLHRLVGDINLDEVDEEFDDDEFENLYSDDI